MVRAKNHGLLVAGDGASAALAALAVARLRPEAPLLLVGEAPNFGGDRPLLVFDDALSEEERDFLDPVTAARWQACYVALPGRTRKLKLAARILAPDLLDAALRQALPAERIPAGRKIVAVRDTNLLLDGGDQLAGDGAVDGRPWAHQTTLDLGWRHAAARTLELPRPHRLDLPVIFDATADAGPGATYFACSPLSPTRLVLEHLRYSPAAEPDSDEATARLDAYAALRGWGEGEIVAEAFAALPVALGGDFAAYYRIGGARVAKLGKRGGFFFPTTGSPLPDAVRNAMLLARQRAFAGDALHELFEQEALAAWKRREPYRALDRKLVGGDTGALTELFSLDAAFLGRFFGERLGLFDRRKLLAVSG